MLRRHLVIGLVLAPTLLAAQGVEPIVRATEALRM